MVLMAPLLSTKSFLLKFWYLPEFVPVVVIRLISDY